MLIERAKSIGVELREGTRLVRLDEDDNQVKGVVVENSVGDAVSAPREANGFPYSYKIPGDFVVMAVGAWTPYLLPFTRKFFRATGQPVFHLKPSKPELFAPERFPVFGDEKNLREFLASTFPSLANAPILYTRVCMYSDTHDGHFWIARDPEREGLVVAAGDSGHGFKFAPVLGEIIADALEGKDNPLLDKFRWRPEMRAGTGTDVARSKGKL